MVSESTKTIVVRNASSLKLQNANVNKLLLLTFLDAYKPQNKIMCSALSELCLLLLQDSCVAQSQYFYGWLNETSPKYYQFDRVCVYQESFCFCTKFAVIFFSKTRKVKLLH